MKERPNKEVKSGLHFLGLDPRAGVCMLIAANIGMFLEQTSRQGNLITLVMLLILIVYGCFRQALKGAAILAVLYILQAFVLPVSPKAVIMIFSVFVNMARRMLPCFLVGALLIHKCSTQEFVVGMRKLHLPQNLITALSVTIRYFPSLREEIRHIHDAMKLQRIPLGSRFECYVVPVILSAGTTADELSAAAVTRGIDNPAPKTSIVDISFGISDLLMVVLCCAGVVFTLLYIH